MSALRLDEHCFQGSRCHGQDKCNLFYLVMFDVFGEPFKSMRYFTGKGIVRRTAEALVGYRVQAFDYSKSVTDLSPMPSI